MRREGATSYDARMGQRRSHRIPLGVPVEFGPGDSSHKVHGTAKDISLGGMYIETASPAAVGVTLLLGFTLPGHRKPMFVSGTVRWTSKSGMGVQFGPLRASETHAITEMRRAHGSSPPGPG
jgi:type IV pilus assembly protein PilZ